MGNRSPIHRVRERIRQELKKDRFLSDIGKLGAHAKHYGKKQTVQDEGRESRTDDAPKDQGRIEPGAEAGKGEQG